MSTMHTIDTPLTAQDRCDRCGAQAKVAVQFEAGPLMFCQHHANQFLVRQ